MHQLRLTIKMEAALGCFDGILVISLYTILGLHDLSHKMKNNTEFKRDS